MANIATTASDVNIFIITVAELLAGLPSRQKNYCLNCLVMEYFSIDESVVRTAVDYLRK